MQRFLNKPSPRPHVFKRFGFSAEDWNAALLKGLAGAPRNHRYLDVTIPSSFRSEAHPNKSILQGEEDCVHWSLPGVADLWNELLLQMLNS